MAWKVSFDPDKFEEALEWFRARTPMRAGIYYALEARNRDDAFTVAHVAQMDVIQQVLGAIDKAIETGQGLRQFSKEVGEALIAAWQGKVANPAWRLETVFRTNTGSAFSRGRQLQMDTPVVAAIRPWRLFDDTRDARESEICRACRGTIVRFDDPWLNEHTPLLHHCCRSHIRALREEQAKRQDKFGKTPPREKAADGFGIKPTLANTQLTRLKPDYAQYDRELAAKAKAKEAKKRPRPPPRPKVDPKTTPEYWSAKHREQYGEAAEAVGHGQAMLERGKLTSPTEVAEAATEFGEWGVAQRTSLKAAIQKYPKAKSIGDLTKALRKTGLAQYQVDADRIESLAALHAHRKEIAGGTELAAPRVKVAFASEQNGEKAMESGRKWLGRYAGTKLKYSHQDAFYQPGDRAKYIPKDLYGLQFMSFRDATSFVHESGHKLEFENPTLARRAKAFLRARTKGQPPRPLAELIPGSSYGSDELAVSDGFLEPYCGKIYEDDGTELTSMGLQWLYAGEGARLLHHDPEMFYFILGQLVG